MNKISPLIVVINATGNQSSSVVRAASAAGFQVRAQARSASKPEAQTLSALPNVALAEGSLEDTAFVSTLFNPLRYCAQVKDADYAWVNTTFLQPEEMAIGKSLALAAKEAGVKHYVYSSLPDHSKITNGKWRNPVYAGKFAVEEYIRSFDNFPATFVYVGGYLENYNKSRWINVERKEDGSIAMSGKLDPDSRVPSIEIERDLGPAVVNILKQGPAIWNHKRIALSFEYLSMNELARRFTEATGIKVTYQQNSKELDASKFIDTVYGVTNDEVYYDWEWTTEEARELNPNWHSVEDFAKNKWKKPELNK